jgi:hypothetical protein
MHKQSSTIILSASAIAVTVKFECQFSPHVQPHASCTASHQLYTTVKSRACGLSVVCDVAWSSCQNACAAGYVVTHRLSTWLLPECPRCCMESTMCEMPKRSLSRGLRLNITMNEVGLPDRGAGQSRPDGADQLGGGGRQLQGTPCATAVHVLGAVLQQTFYS